MKANEDFDLQEMFSPGTFTTEGLVEAALAQLSENDRRRFFTEPLAIEQMVITEALQYLHETIDFYTKLAMLLRNEFRAREAIYEYSLTPNPEEKEAFRCWTQRKPHLLIEQRNSGEGAWVCVAICFRQLQITLKEELDNSSPSSSSILYAQHCVTRRENIKKLKSELKNSVMNLRSLAEESPLTRPHSSRCFYNIAETLTEHYKHVLAFDEHHAQIMQQHPVDVIAAADKEINQEIKELLQLVRQNQGLRKFRIVHVAQILGVSRDTIEDDIRNLIKRKQMIKQDGQFELTTEDFQKIVLFRADKNKKIRPEKRTEFLKRLKIELGKLMSNVERSVNTNSK
jgi:hypothetical protein